MNFPKRVPVFANPQEGSSIWNESRALNILLSLFSGICLPFRNKAGRILASRNHRNSDQVPILPARILRSQPGYHTAMSTSIKYPSFREWDRESRALDSSSK